jgi:hypothetical protein
VSIERLRSVIKQRIEEGKQPILLECEVLSVSKSKETCEVLHLDSGVEYTEVQLKPFESGKLGIGLIVFPTPGSICTVGIVDLYSTEGMMINCSEIESMKLKMDGLEVTVDKKGLKLNGGKLGGIPIAKEIATRLASLEAKHDALATYLGGLPVPVTSAVSGPPVPASVAGFLIGTVTTEALISDTKITH